MIIKNHILICVLVFVVFHANGQVSTTIKPTNNINTQSNIKASYLGSIVYPDFKVGIERPYKEIIKTKRSGKVLDKDRLWSLNAGFYHHATFKQYPKRKARE